MDNKASQIYLRNKLKKLTDIAIMKRVPNRVQNSLDHSWMDYVATAKDWDYVVSISELEKFIRWSQENTRKSLTEKRRIFSKFNIVLTDEEAAHQIKVPIENECLEVLQGSCPFPLELQYHIGKYRLDAFIPRLQMGIQIDEHGHGNYDANEEKELDTVLRGRNIVCIRFNPHEKYLHSPGLELVRRVWERTISPDFVTFREKNKLV
jgi:hypothetical protein